MTEGREACSASDAERIAELADVARRARVDVDRDAYVAARRDPRRPIFVAGNLAAPVCVIGRDLGREEVLAGQPLVGPSGRVVRTAILRAVGRTASPDDPLLERALEYVLLTNLVPFKPRDNRPFPARVREAFRPCVERLLVCCFRGDWVLTLGNEAFDWFVRYANPSDVSRARAGRPGRFAAELECRLSALCGGREIERALTVCPLPHPSPANTRYRTRLTDMLARRLERCLRSDTA